MRKAVVALLVLLAVAGGIAAFRVLDPVGFADQKRALRLALGLPKQWATGFNTDVAGLAPLPCPRGDAIVIVTGGQSNAANALAAPLAGDPAVPAYMMHGSACYRLRDPVVGATGREGSLWTALGTALARRTGRPVVLISGAVGGAQLGDWLDDRSGYRARLLGQVAAAQAAGLAPDYVVWVQGETDAAVRLDPALYVRQMQQLVAAFDAAGVARTPWLVFRSTRCKERPNNGAAIDAAVARWAAASTRIVLGPNASALGNDARRDECHFNGRGRDILVGELLQQLPD